MLFEVGDRVVHPVYGAGRITRIEKRQEGDNASTYYVIPTEPGSTNLLVPTDAASELGLREVVDPSVIDSVLEVLRSEPQTPPECKALNGPLKKINWSDPHFLAELIRDLVPVERLGKISAVQRKALKRAEKLLLGEICLVLGLEYAVAEQLVYEQVEKRSGETETAQSATT